MAKDIFTNKWITENAVNICARYDDGILTLRGLHYQLVGLGMINDIQHYKRVVHAMIDARWAGIISFDAFSDNDRAMIGYTFARETILEDKIERAKDQVRAWMTNYSKNKWENQPIYPELFIEKKALQGVFEIPCNELGVALGACKGYPSLTLLKDASYRFREQINNGKKGVMIYFGDYDPSGMDIPRSIQENMTRLGADIELRRVALMEDQVVAWHLPPGPTKDTDSRTANWGGIGQVELDAVEPNKLMQMARDAINDCFDPDLYKKLMTKQKKEETEYRIQLKAYVNKIAEED